MGCCISDSSKNGSPEADQSKTCIRFDQISDFIQSSGGGWWLVVGGWWLVAGGGHLSSGQTRCHRNASIVS
jgi:hypothetical protein